MRIKLFDSELRIMDILWKEGNTTAKRLAQILKEQVGWSKTTTYTVIKKCVDKHLVKRTEPNFVCSPLITKEEVQEFETTKLINKMYEGAPDQLIASILESKTLTKQEIEHLKQIVENLD